MQKAKARESIQRQLIQPLVDKLPKKSPGHRACLRTAGLAIAQALLDKTVPLSTVRQDLEDLRETIDFAITVVKMGENPEKLH